MSMLLFINVVSTCVYYASHINTVYIVRVFDCVIPLFVKKYVARSRVVRGSTRFVDCRSPFVTVVMPVIFFTSPVNSISHSVCGMYRIYPCAKFYISCCSDLSVIPV
jgi:hypothetical protein